MHGNVGDKSKTGRKLDVLVHHVKCHKETLDKATSVLASTVGVKDAMKKLDGIYKRKEVYLVSDGHGGSPCKCLKKASHSTPPIVSPLPRRSQRLAPVIPQFVPANGVMFNPREVVQILNSVSNKEVKSKLIESWLEDKKVGVASREGINKIPRNA